MAINYAIRGLSGCVHGNGLVLEVHPSKLLSAIYTKTCRFRCKGHVLTPPISFPKQNNPPSAVSHTHHQAPAAHASHATRGLSPPGPSCTRTDSAPSLAKLSNSCHSTERARWSSQGEPGALPNRPPWSEKVATWSTIGKGYRSSSRTILGCWATSRWACHL